MTNKPIERFDAYTRIGKIARTNWVGKRTIPRCHPTLQPAIDDGIESIVSNKTYAEYPPIHGGYRRALLWNFTAEKLTRIKAMMEEDIQVINHLLTQLEEE